MNVNPNPLDLAKWKEEMSGAIYKTKLEEVDSFLDERIKEVSSFLNEPEKHREELIGIASKFDKELLEKFPYTDAQLMSEVADNPKLQEMLGKIGKLTKMLIPYIPKEGA